MGSRAPHRTRIESPCCAATLGVRRRLRRQAPTGATSRSPAPYTLVVSSLVVVWFTRRCRGPGAARSLFGPRSGMFPRAVSGPRRVGGGGTHRGCRAARAHGHPPAVTEEQDPLLRDGLSEWWMPLRGWCTNERAKGRSLGYHLGEGTPPRSERSSTNCRRPAACTPSWWASTPPPWGRTSGGVRALLPKAHPRHPQVRFPHRPAARPHRRMA